MPLTGLTGRWLVSPDDEVTRSEARVVHPRFGARMERLAELRAAMPAGVTADLNDETLLAIDAGLRRVREGTR